MPQHVRGKASPQGMIFRCAVPRLSEHSERMTKIKSSVALDASSIVVFGFGHARAWRGTGEFLMLAASSRHKSKRGGFISLEGVQPDIREENPFNFRSPSEEN